jgi:hypothetical protein
MLTNKDDNVMGQQLNTLVTLYEHHLDLFLKWITVYAGICAGVAAYLFQGGGDASAKRIIPLFIALASFSVSVGCYYMWSWLKDIERKVKKLSSRLEKDPFPSFLGVRMTLLALLVTLIFAVSSMFYFIIAEWAWIKSIFSGSR